MKTLPVILLIVASFAGARAAREAATSAHGKIEVVDEPLALSPSVAPIATLGYRELFADLYFIRLRIYYGDYYNSSAQQIAALSESITAVDPKFKSAYSYGANAMTIARHGVDQSMFRRAIALLEKGIAEFPQDWQLAYFTGQMYIQDLQTDDPVLRRTWDERGTLLVESAVRKPGAPLKNATWAAHLRSKLGQRERAIQGLEELLLVTNDKRAREGLLNALATIEKADANEIAAELFEARQLFERDWKANRPALKPTMYILLGKRLPRAFDLTELATGGQDIVGSEGLERLEPLYEDEPAPSSEGGPSSP